MLTDFASNLRVIPQTEWRSLSRQDLLDLLPLTNDPRVDKRDPDSFLSNYPVGSSFRTWIKASLSGDYSNVPRTTKIVRLVDEYSSIYAWGAAWQQYPSDRSKDVGLYVRPDVRRQGLGGRILHELRKEDGQLLPPHMVYVHPWNSAGKAFFKESLR